ncbi:MAG: ComF family protein [Eubacteriales bacterium]
MKMHTLLDYIFIPNGRCPICFRVLFFTKEFICSHCKIELETIQGKRCEKCSKQLHSHDMHYCNDCLQMDYSYTSGFSLYQYEGNIKKIVQLIKFGDCPKLGIYMGSILGEHLMLQQWICDIQLIIPVPLHINRQQERGYNQAEKIALGVVQKFKNSPILSHVDLCLEYLTRYKDNSHQIHLNKLERFKNVKQIFKVEDKESIKNKTILLIDDVYTTGATIQSCSETLIKNGAGRVYFAVLARGNI